MHLSLTLAHLVPQSVGFPGMLSPNAKVRYMMNRMSSSKPGILQALVVLTHLVQFGTQSDSQQRDTMSSVDPDGLLKTCNKNPKKIFNLSALFAISLCLFSINLQYPQKSNH